MRPAVFLDRDGTLIEEVGYLDRIERLALYPWSADAVRLLNRSGFRLVVVTNQAGVARGIFDETFVGEAHRALEARLEASGARIDRYYYCPHHPEAPVEAYRTRCACRKPQPGMIHAAAEELDIDVTQSFVVGDRWLDIEMAQAAGARGLLVRTGYGLTEESRPRDGVRAAVVVDNLMEAVGWILRRSGGGNP